VALVTGGNGGLGQRICHAAAHAGLYTAVSYARSRDQAEGVARELTSRHQIHTVSFACEPTERAAVAGAVGAAPPGISTFSTFSSTTPPTTKAIPFTMTWRDVVEGPEPIELAARQTAAETDFFKI
jgi:NAD(P)-dependent dehydrogenase (short-subunit alcohol dehydrogenase family)